MRTFALFGTKAPDFSKFMVYSHGQEGSGVELVRTFCGQGRRGSVFRDFVRTSFIIGPLSQTRYYHKIWACVTFLHNLEIQFATTRLMFCNKHGYDSEFTLVVKSVLVTAMLIGRSTSIKG